jgi:hypothetical protein
MTRGVVFIRGLAVFAVAFAATLSFAPPPIVWPNCAIVGGCPYAPNVSACFICCTQNCENSADREMCDYCCQGSPKC